MIKNKSCGAALSQYAIILAIILGIIVIAFGALGKNLVSIFKNYADEFGGNNTRMSAINTHTPPTDTNTLTEEIDQSIATPQNPVKKCENNSCSLDFGKFYLSGLPENFNDYIETAGASGGTDKLSDLIKQLALQAQKDNNIPEYEQLLKLSNIGHNLAVMQKYAEDTVNSCNGSSSCMLSEIKKPLEIPQDYDVSISPLPATATYEQLNETMFDIGRARNYLDNKPDEYKENLANKSLAYLFVDQYDSIMKSSNLSDETKGVLQELYWDIGTVNEDFDTNLNNVIWTGGGECYDPITGKQTNLKASTDPFGDFASYKASKITHFDSALMCGAGQYIDSGTQCH